MNEINPLVNLLEPNTPRILIAIPSLDFVHYRFVECLTELQKHALETGLDVTIKFDGGTLVHIAREHLARHAIDNQYSHIFWLDADITFPRSTLHMLLNEQKDFITGIYRARREPYSYTLFRKQGTWEKYTDIPGGTFEIAGCGFGCVLTATRLLRDSMDLFNTCFMPVEGIGEDLCFCERMTRMKEPMYAHSGIRCGHIAHQIITAY